jgi:UTP--glucose-1-phosphate uridylyltransferase
VIFELLASTDGSGRLNLSGALGRLARQERYLAHQVQGARYDLGLPYGLLTAQMALALSGRDRAHVLAQVVELLARQPQAS